MRREYDESNIRDTFLSIVTIKQAANMQDHCCDSKKMCPWLLKDRSVGSRTHIECG